MFQTLGDLLPVALAIALSPFPVVAVVVVLGTPRAAANGAAFAAGWLAGLGVLTTLAVVLTNGAVAADVTDTASDGVAWWRIVLGVALLALAVQKWRNRPQAGSDEPPPAWMTSLDDIDPPRAARLGALLGGVNPKNVALALAAASTIARADLSRGAAALDAAAFVVLASSTVVGAVLAHLVAPERAAAPLAAIRAFMLDNSTAIVIVILLIFGVQLIGDGLAGL